MRIVMMTNTYLPHVGGVARSVDSFAQEFRRLGHRVLVVAPTFEGCPVDEENIFRVPAIQHFNGSDFSVRIPVPGLLAPVLDDFGPQIVHAHHPFLLGDTALRIAALRNLPIVFTHHTMYERYTHYVPGDSPTIQRFIVELATEYANLCDHIIAPSESIRDILVQRGVTTPVSAVPTGIDPAKFARGDGAAARKKHGVPAGAFVVGHVGRLAPEKNLAFLAHAVADFLDQRRDAHFLVVGSGSSEDEIKSIFARRQLSDRLHTTGSLTGQDLADAYHAFDVFAFASKSETQGMVLAEAMTAGIPVVAIDACGAREVVKDGGNGRLLMNEDQAAFAAALREIGDAAMGQREAMATAARETAEEFSLERCARRLLDIYRDLAPSRREQRQAEETPWTQTMRLLETEWMLWSRRVKVAVDSLAETL